MDTFFLEAVALELSERLGGARIDKIHQPGANTLVLRLWNGREELRLLLSAEAGRGRLHLVSTAPPNPAAPARFCQLLRSRLSRLVAVEKVPGERIIRLLCRSGEGDPYTVVAELMGSRTNLLLLDGQGRIVDALHRAAGGREAAPGLPYVPPSAPERCDLARELPAVPPEAADPAVFERWLLARLTPMSPLVARDLAAAAAAGIPPAEALADFRRRWVSREFRPATALLAGKPVLTAFPLPHLPLEEVETFPSPSAAAERFYGEPPSVAGDAKEELREIVRRSRKRLRSRLEKLAADRERLAASGEGRKYGELLLANLHKVRSGMTEVAVEDWYADPPVPLAIPLDPSLSPRENAEIFFRRYKKGRKGEEHLARRLRETEEELAWLEEIDYALSETEGGEELLAIRREMEEGGIPLPRSAPARRRTPELRDLVRRGRTPGGFEIVWGKSSRTNDFVSRQLAAPDDLWFHAHRLPGCHLVLRSRGAPVPQEDLLFAAAVAAGYSRGRHDGKVEVMVAEGKWVRKPKGARPGLVTVEKFRTVVVRPVRLEKTVTGDG